MADVENINGYNVGFAFLRFYREHPEIGQPTGEQDGDVGGSQTFENAMLVWTGQKVMVNWMNASTDKPAWLEGETNREFEV